MKRWQAKAATLLTVALGLGLLVALGQAPSVLFEATFDEGLDASVAVGEAGASAQNVKLRAVSTRVPEAKAAHFGDGSALIYSAEGNISLQQGAIEFAVQPLTPLADTKNHEYFCLGKADQPNTLRIWKTQMFNDLRFRIVSPDGKLMDAITPEAANWLPGIWHHVVCAWNLDQGWLRLYVDGELKGAHTTKPVKMGPMPAQFSVGSNLEGQNSAQAVIDDLRITDRPPPGQQIANQWRRRFYSAERISSINEWQGTVDATSLALLPQPDFTFVVISDPHVSSPGQVARFAHNHRVIKLVEQLNALKPAFVLDSGDIVTTFPGRPDFEACAKRSLELFKALEVPVYHAPGNHDIGNKLQLTYWGDPGPDDVYKKGWYVNKGNLEQYRKYFGPDYFSFDHAGCHFIVLNNALWNSGFPEEAEQTDWLRRDLEAAKNSRLIFVAMHNPLFWVNTDDVGTNNYELINEPMRGELIDLFDKYNVHAVFTGHTHHRISNYLRGTKYLTLPSTTFARNFGNSYGLNPLHVIWDPERVGYYVVRVYGKETRINLVRTYAPLPPMLPLQRGNDSPRMRALGRKSAEIAESTFGIKSAPPPSIDRSNWSVAGTIDGVKPGECAPRQVPQHCWTSQAHAFDDQHEWLQIQLPEPKPVRRIVFYPRPGNFGFPLDFSLQISQDGTHWETIAKREGFKPEPDAPEKGVAFDIGETRQMLAVKLDMTKLSDRDHNRIRAAMMEVELLGENGTDYALEELGATAAAATQASGNRKTIDDHMWSEPTQVGAKWCVLPPEALPWEQIERAKGQLRLPWRVQRAFNLGYPPGLNFVIPITTSNQVYESASSEDLSKAFQAYIRFVATRLGASAAGFMLSPDERVMDKPERLGQLISSFSTEVRAAAPGAKLFVRGFEVSPAGELVGPHVSETLERLDAVLARLNVEGAPEPALAVAAKAIRAANLGPEVWIELHAWQESKHNDVTRAKLLARALTIAQSEGLPIIYWASPFDAGGIVDRVATPAAPMYAYRSVATLLSGAKPLPKDEVAAVSGQVEGVEVHAFRAADGSRLIVLWQPTPPGADVKPAECRVRPAAATGNPIAVDCLTCTLQKLALVNQGGRNIIERLQVRDYPLVIRFPQ